MNDEKLKELLLNYSVPESRPEQIVITQKRAREALVRIIPTRPFSLWMQIKVQASYLSKWFYVVCFLIIIICLLLSVATEMNRTDSIFFGISPLFIIPCSAAVYRTFSSGMIELEAACKYSMTKLFAGKLIVLGSIVFAFVFTFGMPACLSENGFSLRPLLLSLISFTLTATVVLWFGKRNIKHGFAFGILWGAGMACLSLWDVSYELMGTVNIGLILLVLFLGIIVSALAVFRYVKEISYEGVYETWSFSLTA